MDVRTLGVEEEFLVFRKGSAELFDIGPRVVSGAEELAGEEAQFEKELKAAQAETATQPQTDAGRVAAELLDRRRALVTAAERRGARLVASGTSPTGDRSGTTTNPRYHEMAETFGAIERRQLTCAMHVHVSVEDDDEGIHVLDGIAPWLPVLVALGANSPFHDGEDTGYASFRRVQWGQWPTAGPTGPFGSADEYHRLVQELIETGGARDDGMIYFDARLSANYPTVEIRVCDVVPDASVAVALAAIARALVATAATESPDAGPPPPRLEVLRAAHWRAARFGTTERLVDPAHGTRLAPAANVVDALLDRIEPALAAAGDLERVQEAWRDIRLGGTAAERQRAAVTDAGGDIAAAVDATTVRL